MLQEQLNEFFYSNGIDIFGPVSIEEFSRNRYYKSTLIWYQGLSGWVSIEECEELKHLIGTMTTPALDRVQQLSLPNLTPPLSEVAGEKLRSKRKYTIIAIVLGAVLLSFAYYLINRSGNNANDHETRLKDSMVPDSTLIKEAENMDMARKEAEMKTYRMNWEKFILAVPNDFKRKEIGGIEDLKVMVKNNTPYDIDSVKVKVDYIKSNDDIYHTEVMDFEIIRPNSTKELFAPDSKRGVRVICSILVLTSSNMNFCIDKRVKGFAAKTGEDPYKCK